MLGLGKDVPIATGNQSEGLLALVDGKLPDLARAVPTGVLRERAWTDASTTRTRAGRARRIYTTFSTRAPFHMEGGKGTTSKLVKFQMRPTALAK